MKTFKLPFLPLALFLAFFFAVTSSRAAGRTYECPEMCVSGDGICCKTAGGSIYYGVLSKTVR